MNVMNAVQQMIGTWRHAFKLDPDRTIGTEELAAVCRSGTDGIIVGGSTGVTYENTTELLERIRCFGVPCVLEVSELAAVVPGFDGYLIPMVLNSPDSAWIVGHHRKAVERFSSFIPWELLLTEGYIVLNADSAVARLTDADTELGPDAAYACGVVADKLMSLPVVYIEYSGTFGDMNTVRAIREGVERAHLIYGGGIAGPEQAAMVAGLCDTVVVGNIVYTDLGQALLTVNGVKQA